MEPKTNQSIIIFSTFDRSDIYRKIVAQIRDINGMVEGKDETGISKTRRIWHNLDHFH